MCTFENGHECKALKKRLATVVVSEKRRSKIMSEEKTYAMLAAPRAEGGTNYTQIEIVNNSTDKGKRLVEMYCGNGYTPVGTITSAESDCRLRKGFKHDITAKYDKLCKTIRTVADGIEI